MKHMDEMFVEKDEKKLRCGFTTGSCAAAASKAALIMLITGGDIHHVRIMTPKGIVYDADIVNIEKESKGTTYDADIADIEEESKGIAYDADIVDIEKKPKGIVYGAESVGIEKKPNKIAYDAEVVDIEKKPKDNACDAGIVDAEKDTEGNANDAGIVGIEKDPEWGSVSCAVIKDGGDDPDVTTGSRIYARVSFTKEPGIHIFGGEGVGRITKPGLDQPIGEAAINSVPRKMIAENIAEVLEKYGIADRGVAVTISVPGGEEIAKKTFNPKLGITGGISILGTTGIVEPMSDEAIIQTIRTEVHVRRAEGKKMLMVAPGNYGISFLSEVYGIEESDVVMSSNFIYDTVRIAADEGFERLLFAGHIGKLVKVAGGIKNTHSRYGDHRMEILTRLSEECMSDEAFSGVKNELQECVMTDEAVRIINETGQGREVFSKMAGDIKANMESWSEGKAEVEVIVFSKDNEELVATKEAHDFIKGV